MSGKGTVKFYSEEKGYGFITRDDGSDIFVHANAIETGDGSLIQGESVKFSVGQGRKGPQAEHVKYEGEGQ